MEPGASKLVAITIDPAATHHPFTVWDYCTRSFQTVPGDYTVYVGTSLRRQHAAPRPSPVHEGPMTNESPEPDA